MAFSKDFISHELEPGELFCDRYRIARRIADGGMASIYLAADENTRVNVAIKVLFSYYSDNAVIRARFLDEGRIQAMLRHPNIVHVYRVVAEPLLCFVMEFVNGETLEDYLKTVGALNEEQVLEVMLPVMSAIGLAHSKGIIHRDLKPSNILVQSTPRGLVPKVMDFGVAKVTAGRDLTAAGTTVGTLHYMSPEQIVGSRSIDGRADIYSLGVTLYKLVTGEVPFNASTEFALMMAQVEAPPAPPSSIRPDVSRRMEAIILRALEKEPAKRFQSISEFTSALMQLGDDSEVRDTDTMSIPHELLEYAMMADEVATDRTAEYTMEHLTAAGLLAAGDAETTEYGEPTEELSFRIQDEIRADLKARTEQTRVARAPGLNETMELDEADIDIDETVVISRPDIATLTRGDRVSEDGEDEPTVVDDMLATQEMKPRGRDEDDLGPTQEMTRRVGVGVPAGQGPPSGVVSLPVMEGDETLVSRRWTATSTRGVVGLDRGADSKEVTGIQRLNKTDVSAPMFDDREENTAVSAPMFNEGAEGPSQADRIRLGASQKKTIREGDGPAPPVAGFALGTAGLATHRAQERYDADGNLEPITKPERPSAYAQMTQLEESDEVASYLRPQGGHTAQTATDSDDSRRRGLSFIGYVVIGGVVLTGIIVMAIWVVWFR